LDVYFIDAKCVSISSKYMIKTCTVNYSFFGKKNYAICNMQLRIFFEKQLCVFFTPADSSHIWCSIDEVINK